MLGSFAVGGMLAYLTDTDEATNKFTVGNVSIDLTEPHFSQGTDRKTIIPNETIPKDPMITNDGENDTIVFMKVTVPLKKVATANPDGTLTEQKNASNQLTQKTQELFTMKGNPGVSGNSQHTFNLAGSSAVGWIELTDREKISENGTEWTDFTGYAESGKYYYTDGTAYRTYVFGYNTILKTSDNKSTAYVNEQKTVPLFDNVTFLNIVEGQIPKGTELDIKVDAYAIQANYINDIDITSLDSTNLAEIYDVYVNQNT